MGAELFYMVYRAKDDKIVATGTAKECTKQMGLKSAACFRSIVSKSRLGKRSTYEVVVEKEGAIE